MSHRRLITTLWVIVAVLVGAVLLPLLMERDQNDPDTVALFIFSMAVLLFAGYRIVQDWRSAVLKDAPDEPASKIARDTLKAAMPDTAPPEPSDAAGLQNKLSSAFERIPLEQQIGEFAAAGLSMLPGRSIDELLHSWPREEYEKDPYQRLLFTYAIEVEAEPRGRWFTGKGWNWDTECITGPGSYVTVLRKMERITGQDIFTMLSDDARFGESGTANITYALKGGEALKHPVKINHDWADVEAVFKILQDVEAAVGDDRHFYTADNGQSIIVYFIPDETAKAVNKLRSDLLTRLFEDQ